MKRKTKKRVKKVLLRSAIILSWAILIFSALYLPKWKWVRHDKNTINVFVWGDILDPSVVTAFEKETGIKINLSYYSSNEELLVKLKATRGEGYDLIIPSDYAVGILTKEGLLKKLDKAKFKDWNALNPHLLGHYFDPDNTYSIPFEWELYGFGIDKDYFKDHPTPPSWKMIFDPATVHYRITMNNDPIEAIAFGAFYLYGNVSELNSAQLEGVRELLIRQRPWVAAYATFRGDYFLATKNAAVVVASSSYVFRTKRLFPFVGFALPKEGSFLTIENFCIPKPSQKEDLVFRFINFLSTPESAAAHYKTFAFFPATLHAPEALGLDEDAAKLMLGAEKDFEKYHFIQSILPSQEMRDLWVDIKLSLD